MSYDLDTLTLTEMVRLQDQISAAIRKRFEKPLALVFTDVVGSASYFTRFGDEAGRALQQRHFDLVESACASTGGRIVDTAGDGAFSCFGSVDACANAMLSLQKQISADNAPRAREHQLALRTGIHFGLVLTDDVTVRGEAVNLCARLAATSDAGEIRITRAAFLELPTALRVRCLPLPPLELKGIAGKVVSLRLEWREAGTVPVAVRIEETGRVIELPAQDTVTFGRLGSFGTNANQDSGPANDIVLELPDPQASMRISRWHFELRRVGEVYVLRAVSDRATEVDGKPLARSEEIPIRPGSVVRCGNVMTLTFLAAVDPSSRLGLETMGTD